MATFRGHQVESRVKAIVASDSGQGKTAALASLANAGYNVGILDFDNGLDILASYLNPDAVDRIHYITYEDDIPRKKSAWGAFCNTMDVGWKDGEEDLGKIQDWDDSWVLAMDTLHSMGWAAMRATLSQAGKAIDDQPRIQDYGEAGRKMFNRILPLLSKDLKFHLVCNTHLRAEQDDYERTHYYPATIGSALSKELPKFFNNVVRIDSKPNGDRVIRTVSDAKMALKTSAPTAFKKEEPLDLAEFIKKIMNNAKEVSK